MVYCNKLRKPVVAGQFYPSLAKELKNQINKFIDQDAVKKDAIACMLPHAGYIYSGSVAGQTVSAINIKPKIILLGPNHTGYGRPYSIMTEGIWQTPLGEIKVDSVLAKKILQGSKFLEDDSLAHTFEHSLEVELPFLQCQSPSFEIVPITLLSDDTAALKEIGQGISNVLQESNCKDSVLIVASSDMTHYEPQADAERKDKEAIQAILELNEDKLTQKVRTLNITMCGWAAVVVALSLAKGLGAKGAKLIKYQTSGDITGDKTSVVGYAGIIIY